MTWGGEAAGEGSGPLTWCRVALTAPALAAQAALLRHCSQLAALNLFLSPLALQREVRLLGASRRRGLPLGPPTAPLPVTVLCKEIGQA